MSFSLHERKGLVDRLRTEVFDLIVVGGGITGAGILRDAALRGLKVALIERGDFAVGTSSRSSKLIHGGLRYLEMGDVALVFEAVRERQRLMKLAPHLARPQPFVLPVYRQRRRHSVFALDVGLTVYDLLASFAGVMSHRAVRARGLRKMEPLLKSADLQGGVRYYDAMTDDARLVLANVRGGVQAGGVAVSRMTFLEPHMRQGKFNAARVRDEWHGETMLIAGHCLVFAGGPWSDALQQQWHSKSAARKLQPSKGVHVVVPRARLPLAQAAMMTAHDGRVVFALPWSHATVIGTTDTPWQGALDDPPTTTSDAQYLVDTANAHFDAPGGALTLADIVSTWAGIRPLVAQSNGNTYQASREHLVEANGKGLVSVSGGKLTTYRAMAEEAVDAALGLLPEGRAAAARECTTDKDALPGAKSLVDRRRPLDGETARLQGAGVPAEAAQWLVQRYGDEAAEVWRACGVDAKGKDAVVPGLPVLWGEVRWAVEQEMALTAVDVAVRRTSLYYLAGAGLLPVIDELARRICAIGDQPAGRAMELAAELRAHIERHQVQPDVDPNARALPIKAPHAA
jgi:glycerol-3-phosphate dehydrogenase